MKRVLFGLLVTVGLLFGSCSKDQRAVKDLEGTWNATSYKVNGAETIGSGASISMTFEKCKVKKENCPGSSTTTFGQLSETDQFTYKIYEKATKLDIDMVDANDDDITGATITEVTDERFVFNWTDSDGDQYSVVLEK